MALEKIPSENVLVENVLVGKCPCGKWPKCRRATKTWSS
jgi:hypothetical protein